MQGAVSTLTEISERLKTVENGLPSVESEMKNHFADVESNISNLLEMQSSNFKVLMQQFSELRKFTIDSASKHNTPMDTSMVGSDIPMEVVVEETPKIAGMLICPFYKLCIGCP